MDIETLNAINQGMSFSLMMIKVIMGVIALFAIAGFAIYLAGVVRLCFEETRRNKLAPRTARGGSLTSIWKSMPRVPETQVRLTLVTKPYTDVRGDASRPRAVLDGAASMPPAA